MTKRQDLCLQRRSRPEQSDQRQPNQAANISHQPRASPDSTSLASRIEFPTMTGTNRRSAISVTASIIADTFDARAMWPMSDFEAVVFIMTVALLVALAQVAATNTTPLVRQRSQVMLSNSTKARLRGAARAFGSARRSAGQERADKLAVARREGTCNVTAPES